MVFIIRLDEEEQSVLMTVDVRTSIGVEQAVADRPASTRAGWPEKGGLSMNRMEHARLKERRLADDAVKSFAKTNPVAPMPEDHAV